MGNDLLNFTFAFIHQNVYLVWLHLYFYVHHIYLSAFNG